MTNQTEPTDLGPELAARMERLTARRNGSSATIPTPTERTRSVTQSAPGLDPDLAARMERLAARRTPSSAAPESTVGPNTPPSEKLARKRRHPAQGARVASLVLSLATTIGLTGYMASDSPPVRAAASPGVVPGGRATIESSEATDPRTADPPLQTPTTPAPSTTVDNQSLAAATPVAPAPADTVVNGDVFSNRWGDVQVQATFAPDGSLADVTVLQVPSRDRESVQINDYAVPRLNSAALTAQTAQVHTISGATYTSRDYQRSLQSAIDLARANAITNIA